MRKVRGTISEQIRSRLRRPNISGRITQPVLIFSSRITGTSTPSPVSLSSTVLDYGSRAAHLAFERKIESTLFKRPVHFAVRISLSVPLRLMRNEDR